MVKKNIKNTIEKHNLINKNEHIVIGLSGGPDSVCLFSVLCELKDEMGFTLHAVHVNHGFRPGAADEDQQYVENLCCEKRIECTSFVYDCNAIAREEKLSSEEAGRKARYRSFLEVAGKLAASGIPEDKIRIAVAQNADDQAETVLFRLLRGTGTDGLAGIAYSRKEQNIQVIRPLLDTWRKDIEAYCTEHDLAPRTDHTNLQPVYTRNKIRLELIPYLQEHFNPNIAEGLSRLSAIAAEDKEYLWQCAEEAFDRLCITDSDQQSSGLSTETMPVRNTAAAEQTVLDQQGLAALPAAIRHRVIMKALRTQGLTQDAAAVHLEAADSILTACGASKTVEFPGGYRMSVRYGEVVFYRTGGENEALQDNWQIACGGPLTQSRCKQTAAFDMDKIAAAHGAAEAVFRTRMKGDFISIKGGRKKIQDMFVDMKIPKEHRDSIRFAAVGSEVLWLPAQPEKGVRKARYSSRYKLEPDTKNSLSLEFDCEI